VTKTGLPRGTDAGAMIAKGIVTSVLALVNVVSNVFVTPPVIATWIDLMPRLSFTPTEKATTESALAVFVSEMVGAELSLVTLVALESLHAKAAAAAIAATTAAVSLDP